MVVLAAARGMTAPRRTRRSAATVGVQGCVTVDLFVVVLYDTVVTVTELLGLTVTVLVLLGSMDVVTLTVVERPFWVIDLVTTTVDPSLMVIVVAFGVEE